MVAERNPQVGKAVMKFKELSADERTRDLYERREKARRDAAMREKWAAKKMQLDIARNALKMNMQVDDIIKFTGLTRDEIENLKNEEL